MASKPRIAEDFVVRDGHVYVPTWEWSTEETSILGFDCLAEPLTAILCVLIWFPHNNQGLVFSWDFWQADFMQGKGVIAIWEKPNIAIGEPTMYVDSLDRLLGVIRTLAERPTKEK